jgi:hypothetical protein
VPEDVPWVYRRTYRGMAVDSLVTKSLKENCVNAEVKLMIGNIENLHEVWSKLDVSHECPEKYMDALQPTVNLGW